MTAPSRPRPSRSRPGPVPPDRRPPPRPDLIRLLGIVVRGYLEVRSGRRPLEQLAPLLAPRIARRLAAEVHTTRCVAPYRVRRVVARWPAGGACEATVVVDDGHRATALAVRIERHHGSWRVVELAAPEDGHPALRTASNPVAPVVPDAFDLTAP